MQFWSYHQIKLAQTEVTKMYNAESRSTDANSLSDTRDLIEIGNSLSKESMS